MASSEKETLGTVVLAYSGGLDTSTVIPWLKENYDCEVVTYSADLGQSDDLSTIREKALASGATRAHVVDLREEFLNDYAFVVLRAGAIYERKYLLGTSMARPLTAKHQIKIALEENAGAVAHGSTGKGTDQVRFELTYMTLAPHLKIIAPWREWTIRSRLDALDYCHAHNVPVWATKEKIYSTDGNLWHLSFESGPIEDPWNDTPDDATGLLTPILETPDLPGYVTVSFEDGFPIALDGQRLRAIELMAQLNELGGMYAIGRVDLVENRLAGMKNRGVYETPGGTILSEAHRELEHLTLDKMTMRLKDQLAMQYADLVYNGQWFTPAKDALDAFVNETQKVVTGDVRVKLFKGRATAVARRSPYSLYREDLATMGADEVFRQAASSASSVLARR